MKQIGAGYLYDVYDIGKDRVLKRKRGLLRIVSTACLSQLRTTFAHNTIAKKCTNDVREILTSLPPDLFGNPKFLNKYDYEQDKVQLLYEYFDTHTFEENQIIFNKYLDLVIEMLKYGIHDYVYKFKNSYGIGPVGNVVCIDFNETTRSKEHTLVLVRNKHWEQEAQFRKYPEGEFKEFIRGEYGRLLTPQTVADVWGKKLT